jgi:hypothetical protein
MVKNNDEIKAKIKAFEEKFGILPDAIEGEVIEDG